MLTYNRAVGCGLLVIAGIALGAGSMAVVHKSAPLPSFNYLFYSAINNELSIGVKVNGDTEIGPRYDRATEARKLFEMVRGMQTDGQVQDCHETGYRSQFWAHPHDGMSEVFPGPANPPSPRMEWHF